MPRQSSGYQSLVLRSGPVGYWPLDETSGSTAKQIGSASSSLTGTYSANAIPGSLAFPAGGRAPHLTGTTSTIAIADDASWSPGIGGSGLMTLEAWFHAATNGSSSPPLMSKFNGGGNLEYELGLRTGNQLTGYGITNTGGSVILNVAASSSTVYSIIGWHHAVYTFDRAAPLANLYLDGRLVGSSTTASANMSDTVAQLYLGGRQDAGGGPLAGGLAHCAIYNKVLTFAEIQAHYRAGLGYPPVRSTRLR